MWCRSLNGGLWKKKEEENEYEYCMVPGISIHTTVFVMVSCV